MSMQLPTSDDEVLALLRIAGPLSISDLAHAMEVTKTAVRQRVVRLKGQKAIQWEVSRHGPGRPRNFYSLTETGLRRTDLDFIRPALTLWEKSGDLELPREALRRIARVLSSFYAGQIQAQVAAQEMKSVAKLLKQRQPPANEPVAPRKRPAKPSGEITPEQIEAASQMVKAIGGFDRLREMLAVIKEVGGVTKFQDLLES